ncbi:MAG TPA: PrsW family glutamic-type intramembrane protease [Chitinophagales bacterium]|nr:PrsW family glutamic-type intramembrane protease [Chitinophagales bacterium]HMX59633.1 PrsW family glutamic-type intramembrane protease [Chitinophagales bacterium]HMY22255.1 PrsW family glutamic-type intramembrane protease [Chitinophagales bacterium]HNC72110.1 PrsW family glutamic-type intramembrane protease [Chitinophagales bacterium]HNI31421.1 PrsW family glutamic-type intramembrane protease [Chitinophagales bacterium]
MSYTLVILAIAPALAICGYIIHKDRFDKEPIWLMLLAFFFGVFSIFPAGVTTLIGESILGTNASIINTLIHAFLLVALSEEFAKFFFLRYILFRRKEFDEPLDGIVYSVMIGMGFAAFENIFYVAEGGIGIALMRMLTAIPAHAIFAIVMGYYIGQAKFDITHKDDLIRKALVYPTLLHGAYDFFLFQKNIPALSLLSIIGVWIAGKKVFYILKNASEQAAENKDKRI